ncbi:integrase domain-containing protein [Pseudoalteromonas haloplanktis]|uniref:Integrase domain-containing protein n=1 Tax=Pseudoalteromonas haloplanktis TaxID=228 RepID=A0ABU1B7S8_PSEHA|nr:integrase domain-containing protein [Pseudoalteromonas haloplanktis]MDQ9090478.1 integrase domain-containing protein [Pseudoalteromonas haloplanktis]
MPKTIKPLSNNEVKNAKPKEKDYVLSDGKGLQLRVRINGSKHWNFNYYHPINKKRINMGLGTYPDLSLVNARKLAQDARELLALDIDPKEHRESKHKEKLAQEELTLEKVAKEWFDFSSKGLSKNYCDDMWRSLDNHIFPKLGKRPIGKLTAPLVSNVLDPLAKDDRLETVKRLCERLNRVMVFAVNKDYISVNPIAGVKANYNSPKRIHMPTLKPEELPELMQTLANASIKHVTRFLIEWQLHTLTRPGEAAGTRWDEIDFEKKEWTIPANRMKMRKEHVIPLTSQALQLLDAIKPLSGHRDFVFPSDRNPKTHINNETANMALKRMGFEGRLVSHGIRSLGSTTLNEEGFNADIIEAALAHVDKNQVRAAYNRTDYLDKRRELMCWWSEHIERASQGSLSISGVNKLTIVR